jgi:hypothetical protein
VPGRLLGLAAGEAYHLGGVLVLLGLRLSADDGLVRRLRGGQRERGLGPQLPRQPPLALPPLRNHLDLSSIAVKDADKRERERERMTNLLRRPVLRLGGGGEEPPDAPEPAPPPLLLLHLVAVSDLNNATTHSPRRRVSE